MPKRLGFIGGSINSAVGYTHYIASRMDNKWEVVAGCFSSKQDDNIATSDAYGVNRAYDSWQKMVENAKDLDAIAILTPTPMHYEMVMACIEAGYPVICEKALCTSSKEAEAICKAGGQVAVTYNYTGYPMVREMRAAINAGFLGDICHIQIEMPQEGYIRSDAAAPQKWRMEDGAIPTLYLDLADHMIHMVYYLTGKHITSVVADQASFGRHHVVDNTTFLATAGSTMVNGWFSKCAAGYRNGLRVRIFGSKASAEWVQVNPEVLMIHSVDGTTQRLQRGQTCLEASLPRYNRFKAGHPDGFIEAFANLYWDLAEGFPAEYSPEIALQSIRTLEAIDRTSSSGKWGHIDIKPRVNNLLIHKKPKDSMGLISFVAEVEKEFDIELTEDEIHQDDFLTVDGLTKIVEAKR